MRRAFSVLGLAGCLGALLAGAGVRAETAPTGPEPGALAAAFHGDRRLDATVDAAAKNQPLGDWLKSLAGTLNVPLTAGRSAADEKVTLFLKRRPAGEVLTLVARHLEFEWTENKGGYTLVETPEHRRRLEEQRAAEWRALQRWMERLSKLADVPGEQLSARQREVDGALADPALAPERRRTLDEERRLLADWFRHYRAVPVAVGLYRSLTPVQLQRLRTEGFLRLSSAYGTLSPRGVALTHAALASPSDAAPSDVAPHADLTLRLEELARDTGRPNGARQLRLYVELLAVRPNRSTSMLNWRVRSPAVDDEPRKSVEVVADPDLKRPVELTLRPTTAPLAVDVAGIAAYTLAQWKPAVTLADVSEALHRSTGLEVVADAFTRARLDPALLTRQTTVGELLDLLARELDYTWSKQGRVLFLRSRARGYDRAAEVPDRVLRPLLARWATAPAPTVDDLAGLAAALTDSQCQGLSDSGRHEHRTAVGVRRPLSAAPPPAPLGRPHARAA